MPPDELHEIFAAFVRADERRHAEERIFILTALDLVMARWHSDKDGSKAATKQYNKLRTELLKPLSPAKPSNKTKRP